jgi:hypothetical protein
MPDWLGLVRSTLEGGPFDDSDDRAVFEELAQHLEDRYAYLRSQGWNEQQATTLSLRELDDEGLARHLSAALD